MTDVQNILSCFPTVNQIRDAGDGQSFLAQTGYLERIGYERAVTAAMEEQGFVVNPMALYMIFDALTGGGSSLVMPSSSHLRKGTRMERRWWHGCFAERSRKCAV